MYTKIIVAGRLGQNPELRFTASGDAVCGFSVASGRKYKDRNGQEVDTTTWWKVSAWRKQAEIINEHFKKGDPILFDGELKPDPSTGGPRLFQRKDGSWGASYDITLHTFSFLPKGGEKQAETAVEDEAL